MGVSVPLSKDLQAAYEEGEQCWLKVLFEGAPQDEAGEYLDIGPLCKELNAARQAAAEAGAEAAQGKDMYDFNGFFGIETEHHGGGEYIIGIASTLPPGGNLKRYIIPAHTWAVFKGNNFFAEEYATTESAIKYEERIYSDWLPTSGYELADSISVHFNHATEDLENVPFETWLPVK